MSNSSSHNAKTPSPETIGLRLVERLLRAGFGVNEHDPFPFGYRVKLSCGLVVSIFGTNSIIVRGRVNVGNSIQCLNALMPFFPQATEWDTFDIRFADTSKLGQRVGSMGY